MADADGDGPLVGHHVAAGEDARVAGHHVRADLDDAVVDLDAGHAVEQREVGLLAEREHERVGLELLELAGRLREAGLVELHLLDHELALVGLLDRWRASCISTPSSSRLLDLEVVRGHPLARAPVDDDRLLGAEPLGRAGDVHRGVAAAVDDHAPPEQRLLLALHAAQHARRRRGCAPPRRRGCRRACRCGRRRRGRRRRSRPRRIASSDVRDLRVQLELTPRSRMRCDLGVEHVARQAVLGDAEAHHAAGHRARRRGSSPRGRARARW